MDSQSNSVMKHCFEQYIESCSQLSNEQRQLAMAAFYSGWEARNQYQRHLKGELNGSQVSLESSEDLIHNECIKEVIKHTSASLLGFPDGTHQIENGGVEFTPRLRPSDLVKFCQSNLIRYKEYRVKNAAFYNGGGVQREQRVPAFEPFWAKE